MKRFVEGPLLDYGLPGLRPQASLHYGQGAPRKSDFRVPGETPGPRDATQ